MFNAYFLTKATDQAKNPRAQKSISKVPLSNANPLFWLAEKTQIDFGASTSHRLWGSQSVPLVEVPLVEVENSKVCRFLCSPWNQVTFWRVCRCRCWRSDQARTCLQLTAIGQRYGHQLGGAFRCFSMLQHVSATFGLDFLSDPRWLSSQLTSMFFGRVIKPPTLMDLCMFAMSWNLVYFSAMSNLTARSLYTLSPLCSSDLASSFGTLSYKYLHRYLHGLHHETVCPCVTFGPGHQWAQMRWIRWLQWMRHQWRQFSFAPRH